MIDVTLLREDPEKVKASVSAKQMDPSLVDQALDKDKQWREILSKAENLRAEKNKLSRDHNEENLQRAKEIKTELKDIEKKLSKIEEEYFALLDKIPNLVAEGVKTGKGEQDNQVLREWGEKPKFDFDAKDHLELGENLGLIDFEVGAKVAGSQFYFFKGDLVRLELALMQFGIDLLSEKGYMLVSTPDLAKSRYYLGTGYQPKGDEAQIYEIKDMDLGLIATAEVTMAGFHADEVFNKKDLPRKYAALSHCFRQEAGAYGKYSKGLYRVHQFTKLEMFVYTEPNNSEEMHQQILGIEEEIMQKLNLPYRVVEMCSGDLGAIAAKKYDLDAWMPGRGDYGEVTSTSNTLDYQARNLNIKYRDGDHNEYVYMLNGTALTSSRTIIAIMENYQQADGSISVPEVLRKWMGKESINIKNG
jgi:seryl-tRNA synthetase